MFIEALSAIVKKKKNNNPNAHRQKNDPTVAYLPKAMSHSNRKNTPPGHSTKRNLTETLSKRSQTQKNTNTCCLIPVMSSSRTGTTN